MDTGHAARLAALTAFGALPASALWNDTDDLRTTERYEQAVGTAELCRDPIGELTRLLAGTRD
jgi:hypothetical protein